eukprot:CAMPEP_0184379174 /NCGR_PEP_ID=MMETSP0007-20130409/3626_1 /TAXON_ID=97485 /ORGANISM="Prymnesium parvum, Strain Texoma1" /LENGTH=67 /DNA_ID=CAMNT_0026723725 /DNA_START=369 /DNA_END=568 /DNA_ORIENTATION=+
MAQTINERAGRPLFRRTPKGTTGCERALRVGADEPSSPARTGERTKDGWVYSGVTVTSSDGATISSS